jgi:lysophospholipase L1-like esterase
LTQFRRRRLNPENAISSGSPKAKETDVIVRLDRFRPIALAAVAMLFAACGTTSPASTAARTNPAVPSASEPPAASSTSFASPSARTGDILRVIAIGDSIPFGGHFCPGCMAFVDSYADYLHVKTGIQVAVNNRSRDDGATMAMIDTQVAQETVLREQIGESDVVILSVGFNSVLPDSSTGVGCKGDMGTTAESYVTWILASKADCLQAGLDSYAATYDRIFSAITTQRAGKPTLYAAINVHDGNLGDPYFVNAGLPQATKDKMDRWMIDRYDRWNAMLCDRATAHGFACVDVYHLFNGPTGDQPSGPVNTIDGAHPSQIGNDLIARLLERLDATPITR